MKKIFKKACVVLGIMGMGLTTTSCDSEILSALLPILIENIGGMMTNNATQAVAYEGTLKVDSYKCENSEYDPTTKQTAAPQLTVEAIPNAAQKVVTIKIADFKVGDTTISGFSFNTNYDAEKGIIGNGDDAYYTGLTCTVNGKAAGEEDYACVCGTLTQNTLSLTFVDFYTAGKKFQATFSGTLVQNANASGVGH